MRKPLRITTVRGKWAYAVVGWIVVLATNRLVATFADHSVGAEIVATILFVALFVVGARLFRGQDELRDPPRPWWRMTARATLSRRLGVLFAVLAGAMALSGLGLMLPRPPGRPPVAPIDVVTVTTTVLTYGAVAVLYIISGRRLKRLETQQPTPEKVDPALSAPFDDGWPRAR